MQYIAQINRRVKLSRRVEALDYQILMLRAQLEGLKTLRRRTAFNVRRLSGKIRDYERLMKPKWDKDARERRRKFRAAFKARQRRGTV